MGQGPSNSSPATNFTINKRRTSSLSAQQKNNSFVNSNPNPEYSNNNDIMRNEDDICQPQEQQKESMKTKSYLSYRKSTASLSKIFTKKKWKKRRGSISASFNMNDSNVRVELINVNTASEEELMTLRGLDRCLAQNIVNHRELIGGFRKIEDLALVSGMGCSKLTQIRPEICITRRRPGGLSLASSKAPSIESIPSTGTAELTNRPASNLSRTLKQININQATIFDLMTVDGINQAMAARIIEYRDRKGNFRCVEDLRRVGIHRRIIAAIKMNLTTEETEFSDKSSTISSSTPTRPPRHKDMNGTLNGLTSNTIQPVHKSASIELEDEIKSIYDLLSLKTKRPHPTQLFNYYYKSCPAYRVASWNLESMTVEKINNTGVMEVVTRTILENRFSVLAVQEVCDKTVFDKICKELNEPTLRLNSEWTGYRGNWRYVLHPSPMHLNNNDYFLGVLYDSLRIDSVDLPKGNEFGPIQNGSLWQYSLFQIHSYSTTWVLVNVLSIPLETGSLSKGHTDFNQKEITDSVKSLVAATDGCMIVGHFTAVQAQKGLSDMTDLEMIFPTKEECQSSETISQSQPCTLWTTAGLKQYLTDDHGLVEDGLSHLAIPNGWSMGGKVTKFGPLWCTMCSLEPKTLIEEVDNDVETEEKEIIINSNEDYEPVR